MRSHVKNKNKTTKKEKVWNYKQFKVTVMAKLGYQLNIPGKRKLQLKYFLYQSDWPVRISVEALS